MKQTEPNALQRELARSRLAGAHPDADVLTAFAEGSLLARERSEVVAHLAGCAACREVVSIAVSVAPKTVAVGSSLVLQKTRWTTRAWAPWIGIAAAISVVSTVVLVHHRTAPPTTGHDQIALVQPNPTPPPIAAPSQVLSPEEEKQMAKPSVPRPLAADHKAMPVPVTPATPPPPPMSGPRLSAPTEQALQVPQITNSAQQVAVQTTNQTVSVNSDAAQVEPQSAGALDQVVAGAAAAPAPNKKSPAPAARSAAAFGSLMRSAPIASEAAKANARHLWRINPNGQPERTSANGTWQAVSLPGSAGGMRVVAVIGDDVWVGGEAQQLFHSSDGGTTWASVALPNKTGSRPAIAQIRFTSEQAGTIQAEGGMSWTTTDGGATWH